MKFGLYGKKFKKGLTKLLFCDIISTTNRKEVKIQMEIHDKDYLINKYFELKTRERKQMNRTLARIDRDNIRKLEKIISEKYGIPIDKLRQMWYNKYNK